jgi:hypothetical protein
MTTAYGLFAGCVLAALAWIQFTGWSPFGVSQDRVPQSVRDNPGSARPAYGTRSYTGAK